jgi:hypothetical protein
MLLLPLVRVGEGVGRVSVGYGVPVLGPGRRRAGVGREQPLVDANLATFGGTSRRWGWLRSVHLPRGSRGGTPDGRRAVVVGRRRGVGGRGLFEGGSLGCVREQLAEPDPGT